MDYQFNPGLIYLACPYSAENAKVRDDRMEKANQASARLFQQGYNFFSPLSHGAGFMGYLPEGPKFDHKRWMEVDLALLRVCQTLLILPLQGWASSVGVNQEIQAQLSAEKPIFLYGPGQWCAGRYFPGFDVATGVWEDPSNAG